MLQINDAFQLLKVCTNQTAPNVSIFLSKRESLVERPFECNDISPPAAKDEINVSSEIPEHNCHRMSLTVCPLLAAVIPHWCEFIGGRHSSEFNSIWKNERGKKRVNCITFKSFRASGVLGNWCTHAFYDFNGKNVAQTNDKMGHDFGAFYDSFWWNFFGSSSMELFEQQTVCSALKCVLFEMRTTQWNENNAPNKQIQNSLDSKKLLIIHLNTKHAIPTDQPTSHTIQLHSHTHGQFIWM